MNFFFSGCKEDCTGCEACANCCPKNAIKMTEDTEGFRYPSIDQKTCISCHLCSRVCENKDSALKNGLKLVFGGYSLDSNDLLSSTSGAAFSAIAKAWWSSDSLIYGSASTNVLEAKHESARSLDAAQVFRGSKYTQSTIGFSYRDVKQALLAGKSVLFSGTPCQIGGLYSFLENTDTSNLLTVEVICEGVPTPHFMRKMITSLNEGRFKKNPVSSMDYRDKSVNRWDYEVMSFSASTNQHSIDRWFNPFWSIWLSHLMSRPSCYVCPFAKPERGADITLGDLWGVHLYCPDLYNENRGASLVLCNTEKGLRVIEKAKQLMHIRELSYTEAVRYQGPLRHPVALNSQRAEFFEDLQTESYTHLCRKWAKRPSIKLLISKYVFGTNQQVCRKAVKGSIHVKEAGV